MEEYEVMIYKNEKIEQVGIVRLEEDGTGYYKLYMLAEDKIRKLTDNEWFYKFRSDNMDVVRNMLTEENLQKNRRRAVYYCDEFIFIRHPRLTGEHYLVYSRSAKEGQPGYSEKDHSVPHNEPGANDMKEWINYYRFNKFDDGTYEAEIDEAWYCGGSHTDGGTVHLEIHDTWQDLPYDEFLAKVVKTGGSYYLFTADDLKACKGLKKFFGYED